MEPNWIRRAELIKTVQFCLHREKERVCIFMYKMGTVFAGIKLTAFGINAVSAAFCHRGK